ncbi:hypothetical protein [Aureibacter tunicatorum]|uniref:Uncharacterized protein n=1 Tax=Aureibacter tunicatorum TaxID=866807 RepID=A0AAE4BTL5_9BACT|nr:hypothetical protein [Aureibacter tunicatorum]MDR6239938.1 hypothetical protein [Aureibacter tunicatorum]BDD04412.1 hypothetical protein AUTU_18950 [Aureibacter tunicatorum]
MNLLPKIDFLQEKETLSNEECMKLINKHLSNEALNVLADKCQIPGIEKKLLPLAKLL